MNENQSIERETLTVKEVMQTLGVPYSTVLNELKSNRLRGRKIGKAYRVHRDVLQEYMRCPAVESPPVSTCVPTIKPGSSATVAKTLGQACAEQAADALLKKRSRRMC